MNTKQSLNRFVVRCLIATIPLIALLIIYIVIDPFNVITPQLEPTGSIEPYNKGLISISAYQRQYKEQNYNAFILGSSRTIYYRANDWAQHLPNDASILHLDASSETTEGILQKLRYIDNSGGSVKYALIEFAPWSFTMQSSNSLPFRTPPQLSGGSTLSFHMSYFRDFMRRDFIRCYSIYLLTGKIVEFGEKTIFTNSTFNYDRTSNECISDSIDRLIDTDPSSYYHNRFSSEEFDIIFSRDSIPPIYPQSITHEETELLHQISQILQQHHSDYQIIIGPCWDRSIIHPEDLTALQSIFGRERVHDFSKYPAATDSIINFYDNTHYRPHIAKAILDSIYTK